MGLVREVGQGGMSAIAASLADRKVRLCMYFLIVLAPGMPSGISSKILDTLKICALVSFKRHEIIFDQPMMFASSALKHCHAFLRFLEKACSDCLCVALQEVEAENMRKVRRLTRVS